MNVEWTPPKRRTIGHLPVDAVTFDEAIDCVDAMITSGRGGTVYTPNVDHIVQAEDDPRFCDVYSRATLAIADGMPVVWASRLAGLRIPEKVSGSDLIVPLMKRAAERGWRVYFLGGLPGSGEEARAILERDIPGLRVVGVEAPRIDVTDPNEKHDAIVARIREARADLVLVALGAPKQEFFSDAVVDRIRPAVLVGCGGTLDFIAGKVRRAPAWMSDNGLEWLYRLAQEPRRMWKRYLVRDPRFLFVVLRELRRQR